MIPSSTIAVVNEKVNSVSKKPVTTNRGPYMHLTAVQRYIPGRQESISEFGVTNTLKYYAKNFPGLSIKKHL